MTDDLDKRAATAARRKRLARGAAVAGAALAVICHFVPPKYQDACAAVAKAASLSCGGGIP